VDEAALAIHAVAIALRAAVEPLLALAELVHLQIPLLQLILSPPAHAGFTLVEEELSAAIKVASMIVLPSWSFRKI
jgi:hypothetical protein